MASLLFLFRSIFCICIFFSPLCRLLSNRFTFSVSSVGCFYMSVFIFFNSPAGSFFFLQSYHLITSIVSFSHLISLLYFTWIILPEAISNTYLKSKRILLISWNVSMILNNSPDPQKNNKLRDISNLMFEMIYFTSELHYFLFYKVLAIFSVLEFSVWEKWQFVEIYSKRIFENSLGKAGCVW